MGGEGVGGWSCRLTVQMNSGDGSEIVRFEKVSETARCVSVTVCLAK